MTYILITKEAKILLTEQELAVFQKKINTNTVLIPVKGQFVSKHLIAGIYEFEFYLKQEADSLKQKGQRRCKTCGDILPRSERCACSDKPSKISENIFAQEGKKLLLK